jgi:hypothetical protein
VQGTPRREKDVSEPDTSRTVETRRWGAFTDDELSAISSLTGRADASDPLLDAEVVRRLHAEIHAEWNCRHGGPPTARKA